MTTVKPGNMAVSFSFCPLCMGKRLFVRLDTNEISVRCLSCRATPVTLSLVDVLRHIRPILSAQNVYELSSRGPLVNLLKRECSSLTYSEYFDDIPPGEYNNGIQCQDVQALTYPDESFDICTSTEVFEHVPDDRKGFSEVCRVLKAGGVFIFTVPIDISGKTIERAVLSSDGKVRHILPPEYHGDHIRGDNGVLVFRNYGYDILTRLTDSGFKRAEFSRPLCRIPWGYARTVVVAYRGEC